MNNHTKVCIGEFWMKPSHHLLYMGCPKCSMYRLEKEVENFLIENKFNYKFQVNSSTFSWLGLISLDFYLPDYNIAIECQGKQHFQPIDYFGGKVTFEQQVKRDLNKKTLCEKNNLRLLYYTHFATPQYECCKSLEELQKKILGK